MNWLLCILKTTYKFKFSIILFWTCFFVCVYGFIIGLRNSSFNAVIVLLLINTLARLSNKNNLCKVIAYTFLILLTILLSIDIYYLIQFKDSISVGVFSSIIETNVSEAKSMMSGSWYIAIITLSATTTIIYLSFKELTNSRLRGLYSFVLIPIIYFCSFFIHIYIITQGFNKDQAFYKRTIKVDMETDPLLTLHFFSPRINPLIMHDVFSLIIYADEMYKLKKFKNENKTLPIGIKLNSTVSSPTKIYLVIGESSYREHYSLYGYDKKTTPFLDSLSSNTDSTLTYHEGISPACITREALRLSLTFATPKDKKPFFENKSIIDLAKEKGYETVWITNQARSGITESFVTIIAKSSDQIKYMTDSIYDYRKIEDFHLIETLKKLQKDTKKQFIVLHLKGSHMYYEDGYDNEDIEDIPNGDTADYDRTIHHTDRFLEKLYNIVQNKEDDAIIYYFSDHGELVNIGHGMSNTGKEQYQVPLITINHNTDVQVSDIMNKYTDKTNGLIYTLSTINILAEIMGYDIEQDIIEKTVDDGRYIYNPSNQVVLYEEIEDYVKE